MDEVDVFNALKYRTYDPIWKLYEWRNSAGLWHRLDGPAIEYDDGHKIWCINGQPLSEDEFNQRTK